MSQLLMRLVEDRIPAGHAPIYLPRASRALYIVEGGITVEFPEGAQHVPSQTAWLGDSEATLLAGSEAVRTWRWELHDPQQPLPVELRSAPGTTSTLKLEQVVELDSRTDWLMRCDRVDFPPGGVALTHVHQGPGIRCVLSGEITIDTLGAEHTHPVGQAWFELGHAPVLAPTTPSSPTTFIRCFLLPRSCRGRSSIRYVLPEDAAKAKTQQYHVFGERFIH
ncbi:hypothetical protein [Ottowia thiooxydans]|uniref:hypothetical protein n=1 Tax=Ottowia thiooxydans TaxID=219182 RepID=UPI00041D83DE|nr:hypothetical protein [Ottowia thiooxydans]